jgi:DNA-binding transcriptional regulator LsrR (DeoR family)
MSLNDHDHQRFSSAAMLVAARMYYVEDATQAEIATQLSTSRATISRMLSEARRQGIVRIEIHPPAEDARDDLADRLSTALGLRAVHLSTISGHDDLGKSLAPGLADALGEAALLPGDALLISSGRSIYEAARHELPHLPGVVLAPMLGGVDEPEAWYGTNELTRQIAERVGGTPVLLYAPALPSPALHEQLISDPSVRRVLDLWKLARAAVIGVGAPLSTRTQVPGFANSRTNELRESVGDICGRFFDANGTPITFPGSERLISVPLEHLTQIPTTIALATGTAKVPALLAAARARYFNELVTDTDTALNLIAALESQQAA